MMIVEMGDWGRMGSLATICSLFLATPTLAMRIAKTGTVSFHPLGWLDNMQVRISILRPHHLISADLDS